MSKLFFLCQMLFVCCITCTMEMQYQLPNQSNIKKRFKGADLKCFAKKSKIAHNLAGLCISPKNLVTCVDGMLQKYFSSKKPRKENPLFLSRTTVIRILLDDHPAALQILEEYHWIYWSV